MSGAVTLTRLFNPRVHGALFSFPPSRLVRSLPAEATWRMPCRRVSCRMERNESVSRASIGASVPQLWQNTSAPFFAPYPIAEMLSLK